MWQFEISIPNKCAENYKNFTHTKKGGFCSSCQKTVIDFTQFSDEEIIEFFENSTGKTCGRFQKNQLKRYRTFITKPKHYSLDNFYKGFISLSIVSLFSFSEANGRPAKVTPTYIYDSIDKAENLKAFSNQDSISVYGLISYDGESLPGAFITIKGTTTGTKADIKGYYKLDNVKKGSTLVVSFIGFESKEVKVKVNESSSNSFELNVELTESDFALMGEVEVNTIYNSKKSLWNRVKNMFN